MPAGFFRGFSPQIAAIRRKSPQFAAKIGEGAMQPFRGKKRVHGPVWHFAASFHARGAGARWAFIHSRTLLTKSDPALQPEKNFPSKGFGGVPPVFDF